MLLHMPASLALLWRNMTDSVISIDTSSIRREKLEDLKVEIKELVAFVETNEPRPIAYSVYLDESETSMTVVQVHPDSASMEYHMEIAATAFQKFRDYIQLQTIDLYGPASENLIQQMQRKAELLGAATVSVHQQHAGFIRIGNPTSS